MKKSLKRYDAKIPYYFHLTCFYIVFFNTFAVEL